MKKILLQLDGDAQPSVFDSVVAIDAGVDHLLRHHGVTPAKVAPLVHGCIFTRGGDDLKHTAIFVGGSDVSTGEVLLKAVKKAFFGPMRVSVMMDANGCNTTAAAAVIAATRHINLADAQVAVLAGTGPVGQRVARLCLGRGARVKLCSRQLARAEAAVKAFDEQLPVANLSAAQTGSEQELASVLDDVQVVFAAGAAGVELLSNELRQRLASVQVAIDLNAVPPLGIGGLEVFDKAVERDGQICYGAIGVGGTKMKIHKAVLQKLFDSHDAIFDAEQIFEVAVSIEKAH